MARYVDGFVIVVPEKNLKAYKEIAKKAAKVWKKYGALDYKECVGDDMKPMHVSFTFPKMAKAKEGEVVIFSYILYKSRAQRDRVNAAVMEDPVMKAYETEPMPFDMKRFAYGGFEVIA